MRRLALLLLALIFLINPVLAAMQVPDSAAIKPGEIYVWKNSTNFGTKELQYSFMANGDWYRLVIKSASGLVVRHIMVESPVNGLCMLDQEIYYAGGYETSFKFKSFPAPVVITIKVEYVVSPSSLEFEVEDIGTTTTTTVPTIPGTNGSRNPQLLPFIPGGDKFLNGTSNGASNIINGLKNLLGLFGALNGFVYLMDQAKQSFDNIKKKLQDSINWLISLPAQFLGWIANAVHQAQVMVGNAVNTIVGSLKWIATSLGNLVGGFFGAIGGFFGGIIHQLQTGFGWLMQQLGGFWNWINGSIGGIGSNPMNIVLIIAIVLIAVGVVFFRPALWLGVLVLGIWALQIVAHQGNIIQGLFGNTKNMLMVILGLAGLIVLLRR